MCVLQSNYPSDKSGAASISTAIYDILLSRYRGDCTKIDNTNLQSTLKKYNMMLKLYSLPNPSRRGLFRFTSQMKPPARPPTCPFIQHNPSHTLDLNPQHSSLNPHPITTPSPPPSLSSQHHSSVPPVHPASKPDSSATQQHA